MSFIVIRYGCELSTYLSEQEMMKKGAEVAEKRLNLSHPKKK